MKMEVGDRIFFGSRSGRVIGYWIDKRYGYAEKVNSYYIVDLDKESRGWILGDNRNEDMFCSVVLVNMENDKDAVAV